MTYKVSVISIYYNRRDHIIDSINSLLEQTYNDLEIIIVDDCSSDGTFEILKENFSDIPNLKLMQNDYNQGFTRSLIDAIKISDGDLIAIHGAGDTSMPSRIEEQQSYLEKNPSVGVVAVDLTNRTKITFSKLEINIKDLLIKNRIIHGAVMFRKEIYNQVGGYRSFFTSRQDKDLWFRMSFATKIHFMPTKLYTLTDIKSSVSQTASYSLLPILLSSFATELAKERLRSGTDKLDKFGPTSALLFNPAKINSLLLNIMFWELYMLRLGNLKRYLTFFLSINRKFIIFFVLICVSLIMFYFLF